MALFLAFALAAVPPGAHAATSSVQLSSVGAKKNPTSLVTFNGRAGKRSGAKVSIERKSGKAWRSIAKGRTGAKGRFSLTWISPSKAGRFEVRAKLGSSVSKSRKFRVTAPLKGAPKIIVSPLTRIISPSVVQTVPQPGQAGSVTYAGGNDAQKGQIVVVGQGESTPNGFLGKVTNVERSDGKTVVETVPATLLDAVPEGSMNLVAESVTAKPARRAARGGITCEGSVAASITHDITFTSGLALKGSWTFLGGLQSASLTASADVNASVQAAIAASGSCSLAKRALFSVKGPSLSGFVGPVPVVMTSNLTVYLDANASAQASLSTGANAGFSASAGVAWNKGRGFSGIQSFTPRFGFDPPTLSAGASAAVNVTPTVDVLLYGVVGPRVALRTGVQFTADTTQDPWWTLDVPVDLTASITIAPLNLTSPELHVYQTSFPIANAGGPLGGGPSVPAEPVTNVPSKVGIFAGGYAHSCTRRSSGAVACWGANGNGQLGNGTKNASPKPVAVNGLTDAVAVAAGNYHSCALRVSGAVVCWGRNTSGALGNPVVGDQAVPVAVTGITNAIAITAGLDHSCALLATGRIMCWGVADGPQLGSGNATPKLVTGITNATAISSGPAHACAVLATGGVSCWGENSNGARGTGDRIGNTAPNVVGGITNATAIATGTGHSCAVLSTGGVTCWGVSTDGQLGNGSRAERLLPVATSGITNAIGISAGFAHTCALLTTGEVKCWGDNEWGEVGDGSRPADSTTPVNVSGIANAATMAAGYEHSCAVLTTGALKCWGYGADGELGDGTTETRAMPVNVLGLP